MILNIHDKVKIKKLTEEEFENAIYGKHRYLGWNYKQYLNYYTNFFNLVGIIEEIDKSDLQKFKVFVYKKNNFYWFCLDELELYRDIQIKIKFVKELIK